MIRVESAKHVERIIRSVIADNGLTHLSLGDLWVDQGGWGVKVTSNGTLERSFHVGRGTPAAVRVEVARHLGVRR